MEDERSSRIFELKRKIYLLEQDEQRLQWLMASQFTTDRLKLAAQRDLVLMLEKLAEATDELSELEKEQ